MIEFHRCENEAQFDAFVEQHPYAHFMKTTAWGRFRVEIEKDEAYFPCVLTKDDQIIASSLAVLTYRKGLGKILYVPWGYCIDYNNLELVKLMSDHLDALAKQLDCTMLKVDLNVERVHHELDGTVIDDGFNQEYIAENMKQLGFKHKGYGYAYNGSWVNRYTLICHLQEEDYTKRIHKKTYKQALRQIHLGATLRKGTDTDFEQFAEFAKELSVTHRFVPHTANYFRDYVRLLAPYARFMVTEIDFELRLKNLLEDSEKPSLKKDKEAYQAVLNNIEKCRQQLETGISKIMVCGAIYLHIGKKVYNMYLYNDKNYTSMAPSACSHIMMMEQMKQAGVEDFDFVGFATTNPNDAYYGLYEFKSLFGTRFVEYLGEFDKEYKPLRIQTTKLLKKLKKKLK